MNDLSSPPLIVTSNERSPSLRSTGSQSSLSSSISLTRRPRTRTRSRTVTGNQPSSTIPAAEPNIVLDQLVSEPESLTAPRSRSSQRSEVPDNVPPPPPPEENGQNTRPAILQPKMFIAPASNVRDSFMSGMTQQSAVSSSLYPPSTSTASGTESPPSPRSLLSPDGDYDVPIMDDLQEYDGDDVSYRLRLLVKNNYFLPPAHAKPSVSELSPLPTSPARKLSSPAFLDYFRGKTKPKTGPIVTTPQDILGPALRSASDASNSSAYAPYTQPHSSASTPNRPDSAHDRAGRVMVVREKMPDLVGAAKQAEQDIKLRSGVRDQGSQRGQQYDDIIDPTDAVDLPLPSAKYPFAVQASALHGLGVQDSLGAALLADRLPPPTSSGFSVDPEDDWRRQLLRAAVGHSLDSIQGSSAPHSPMSGMITPHSPMSDMSRSPRPSVGRQIISNPILATSASDSSPSHTKQSMDPIRARGMSSPTPSHTQHESYLPLRAEVPAPALTPLSPRRRVINPLYSISQTDISGTAQQVAPSPSSRDPIPSMRKSISSPGLSQARRLTPPPLLPTDVSIDNPTSSFDSTRKHLAESEQCDSLYSEVGSRCSSTVSYYSPASPAASAFRDALNNQPRSSLANSFASRSSHDRSIASPPPPPPPRDSLDIYPETITPPPRSSSLQGTQPRRFLQASSALHSQGSRIDTISLDLMEPAPTTPPYDTSPRHSLALGLPNDDDFHVDIQSTPMSSSPTSFFDTLQSQPNALDDLDSSSESESDDEGDISEAGDNYNSADYSSRTQLAPPSRSSHQSHDTERRGLTERPSLTRLGNHSTPYVAQPSLLPFGVTDPTQPIGHVPARTFFSDKMSERGGANITSSFDFYKYAQEHPVEPGPSSVQRRPATADDSGKPPSHKASLQRLDGLMIQHMEAEKDRLKQIASSIQSNTTNKF